METTTATADRYEVPCSKCRGRGRLPFAYANGVCFACQGAGRYVGSHKADAAKAKRAAAAEAKRAAAFVPVLAARAARWAEFSAAYPELAATVEAFETDGTYQGPFLATECRLTVAGELCKSIRTLAECAEYVARMIVR